MSIDFSKFIAFFQKNMVFRHFSRIFLQFRKSLTFIFFSELKQKKSLPAVSKESGEGILPV